MKLSESVRKAKRVYLIGNGGSYANASHIANDLIACGVKAFTLDPSSLTAFANDYGYDTVFSRWISTVGEAGDLLIALSGSGKSPNILNAIEEAKKLGMEVIFVTRYLKDLDMQASEEEQLYVGHEIMRTLRSER